MKILQVNKAIFIAIAVAVLATAIATVTFVALEPAVGHATSQAVTISSTVTAELALSVASTALTLSPPIAGGVTGGVSNGSTDVVVVTNNADGYNMTIKFSSSTAMDRVGGGVGRGNIYNYVSTTIPDYTFDSTQVYAQFGYSIYSSTDAGDVDSAFLNNGIDTCGTGSVSAATTCWLAPSSTVAKTIVNRTSATSVAGATTTIQFRVDMPGNASPLVPTGTYTATATLTALAN